MSLRSLSVGYLVCATVFGLMVARHDHPDWARMTDRIALEWRDKARTQIVDASRRIFPDHKPLTSWAEKRPVSKAPPHTPSPAPQPAQVPTNPQLAEPEIVVVPLPPSKPAEVETANAEREIAPPRAVRQAETPKPNFLVTPPTKVQKPSFVPPEEVPSAPPRLTLAPNPAQLVRVRERLAQSLTHDLSENFELFLYVSKAEAGPWAQQMHVFERQKSGDLKSLYVWPVSTGREKVEYNKRGQRLPSFTPAGYYQLDPRRSYRKYRSVQWDQNMPFAMFFNWIKDGNQTGLAIHGADGSDIALLGSRSSAGCIRLAPDNAELLFNLIRTRYRGEAPKFAFDRRTGTMSNEGMLKRDAVGQLEFTQGYKVLVLIENYGGQDVVATLY